MFLSLPNLFILIQSVSNCLSLLLFCREAASLTQNVDGFVELDLEKEKPEPKEEAPQPPEIKDPNDVDGQIHRHFILIAINFVGIILVSYHHKYLN